MESEQTSITSGLCFCGEFSNPVGTEPQPNSQRGLRVYGRVDDIRRDRYVRALAELGSSGVGDLWCALNYQRSTAPLNDVSGVRD
jgi:hypothetical protein